jgi:hypothetical protein
MFLPFSKNDQDFIDDAIAQGATKEEAEDVLYDRYQQYAQDGE